MTGKTGLKCYFKDNFNVYTRCTVDVKYDRFYFYFKITYPVRRRSHTDGGGDKSIVQIN